MNDIILIGNPNTGKTTLFNTMTGANEKASNWHGVTVGEKSKRYKYKNQEYNVTDLPGMYSLEGYSNEEQIAKKYLLNHKDALIINICDANNMIRNLKLTAELAELNLNMVLAVNMCTECSLVDYKKLSKELNIKIIEIDARNKKSVDGLKAVVVSILQNKKPQKILKTIKINPKYDELIKNIAINTKINPYNATDKIDKLLLNKWIFPFVFLLSIFVIFYLTFGIVGLTISSYFNTIFNKIATIMQKIIKCTNINIILKNLLCEGVIEGLLAVVSFLPQIVMLMFFLNILEDIGFMSRIAFMFDGMLKKLGLTGKSLFSLCMGYGCTTSAVMSTRNLENKNLRKKTIMLLPFVSCSAKLPIYLVIASLFFEKYKYLYVFLIYCFSIILMIIFALIYKKITPQSNEVFILEMPKYRRPYLPKILKDCVSVAKDFLLKVGTTLLLFNAVFWLLQNFTIDFKYLNGENFEQSLLYNLTKVISPIFSPIGLGNVGIVVALIFGIVAKEMIVAGLCMINGVGALELSASLVSVSAVCHFDIASSVVFLIFVLIYSPCMSALASIKNEMGIKLAITVFALQFIIAYGCSFVVCRLFIYPKLLIWLTLFIILDILFCVVLKLNKKVTCQGNCNACRKI